MSPARFPDARAWVLTVDMGLGHQRAVYPLQNQIAEQVITAGAPEYSDPDEQRLWDRVRSSYEFLSRVRSTPLVGKPLFSLLDNLQNIPPFYPLRDMSKPTYQVKLVSSLIRRGIAQGALEVTRREPLPLVSSHPIPALAADAEGARRNYCIVSDAEISRAWVAEEPEKSNIVYLAPCGNAVRRLRRYGVQDDRILLTGFPLPTELLGGPDLPVLRADVGQRLNHLDPENRFWSLHRPSVEHFLGRRNCKFRRDRLFTVTFAVGGAGAQREIGYKIAKSLRERLRRGELRLNLVAGIRPEVRDYFTEVRRELGLENAELYIYYRDTKQEYFRIFSEVLRATDILWTKPSELSFYAGLGLPIVMAPTIGSQEQYNRKWLQEVQAGIEQEEPEYAHDWLFDFLKRGRFAESAWDGFLKARKMGTYKIREIVATGTMQPETEPLRR
jgi:hypothetical protein